jgi:diguanylate cyclase (GGDEF)-like protein
MAAERAGDLLKAPPGSHGFQSFGEEQGLTNLSTTALAQDSQDTFWVGTEDGLFRLEGKTLTRFGTADGLPSANIEIGGLAPGNTRGLWVGTTRGLVFYDGGKFLRPSALGLTGLDEQPCLPLPQGGVILSDLSRKVRYLALDGGDFSVLEGLPWGQGMTAAVHVAARDLLLVALGGDLWIRHAGLWTHRDFSAELHQEIRALRLDAQGQVWLRCSERLARLKTLTAPLEVLPTPIPLSLIRSADLGEDALGRIWTNGPQGLIWTDGQETGQIGPREGLPQGGAMLLAVDRQGSVWIGGEGCHKLLGDGLWTGWTRRQGLPADVVWSVTRTGDGLLWAGTSAGLAVGEERGWNLLPGTQGNQIMAFAEDSVGNLWVGHQPSARRPGALSVRPKGTRELHRVAVPGLASDNSITALLVQRGELWMATTEGLWRGTLRNLRMTATRVRIGSWPEGSIIYRVVADGEEGLWVAGDLGVAHWDGQSWATLAAVPGGAEGAASVLASRSPGEAWVALRQVRALLRIRREDHSLVLLQSLSPTHRLLQDPIASLHSQRDGVLWVGTSRGLLRWDGERIERFGRNFGLPGEDCAMNALWFDATGDVWTGLSVGLARGRLGLQKHRQTPPPAIVFEAQRSDGTSLLAPGMGGSVPWAFRTLTLHYGPKGTRDTEDVTYQVRMLGLEDAWRSTPFTEARYPGLSAGTYRFEVRTVNSVGESGPPIGLDVVILAPWWQRPWFLLLVWVSVVALVLLVIRWRLRQMHRLNQQLEALVQVRTQELETANRYLMEASLVDPLTELHNRRFLTLTMPEEEERIHRVFRQFLQRGESPQAHQEDMVLFLGDLDHFKQINDTYGHPAGDRVLKEAAQVLRGASRLADTLVRWGGEEFLLVAKRMDREKAHLIAEKLCQAVRDHTFTLADGRTLRCTLSIGFAAFPILASEPEALGWEDTLHVADKCLYAAKHAGRDGWVSVHSPIQMDPFELARRFKADLRGLVQEGKVEVHTSFPKGAPFGRTEF